MEVKKIDVEVEGEDIYICTGVSSEKLTINCAIVLSFELTDAIEKAKENCDE